MESHNSLDKFKTFYVNNFRGPTATAFLELLSPSSLHSLKLYTSLLSILLNERGGIIDNAIIPKHFYVITNPGRRERDLAWFKERFDEWNAGELAREKGQVEHEVPEDPGVLALQGPEVAQYLRGFAFYCLLSNPPVQLTSLGACDSLRLEAGKCLYSQDLDEDMPSIEAVLVWVIDGKDWCENGTFIGTECVRKHLKEGPPWMRIGMIVEGAPARLDNTRTNGKSGKSGSKRVFVPPEKISEPGKALVPFSWDKPHGRQKGNNYFDRKASSRLGELLNERYGWNSSTFVMTT
ncbi:Aminomethyltransferase folate-binding domain-containing protein [Trametes sanguinea]|nr:Aminomethyltransferase folate-binding domain-containing protein [Trametes sanguinea]